MAILKADRSPYRSVLILRLGCEISLRGVELRSGSVRMPSMDGIFSGLRERTRRALVGEHCAEGILRHLRDGPKYVSLATLSSVFTNAGLTWSNEETEFVVRKFADNR